MGSFSVVVAQPGFELLAPLVGGSVGPLVGPLAEHGLDEAFRLAVGLGPIGPGAELSDVEVAAGVLEGVGDVATAVVGHDPLGPDAVAPEPAKRPTQERHGGLSAFVGQHFDVGESTVVIDADVSELPASTAVAALTIAGDAMSNPAEAPEFLGVEVQELARPIALVADHRRLGFETAEPLEPEALQHGRDGRPRHGQAAADLRACEPMSASEPLDALLPQPGRAGDPSRGAGTIPKSLRAFGAISSQPAVRGALADPGGLGGVTHRPPESQDPFGQQFSGVRSRLRVRMESHLGSPLDELESGNPILSGGNPGEQCSWN